jgi:hypothetical protein
MALLEHERAGRAMFGSMYYRHSGGFSSSRLALFLPIGLVLAIVLGVAYGYLFAYLPVVGYISFILAAGFGLAVGFGIVFLAGLAHVRSRPVMILLTLLVAGVAYYTSWVAWVHAIAGRADVGIPFGELATSPGLLWSLISAINENGVMSISGWIPQGAILWLFWFAELLLIFVPALITVMNVRSSAVYCEACKAWCTQAPAIDLSVADLDGMAPRLEAGDVQTLMALPPRDPDAAAWTRVEVMRCGCTKTNTLTVKSVWIETDDEGAESEKDAVVINRLIIDRPTAEQITGAT